VNTTRTADLHCDTVLEIQGGADLVSGNPDGHVDVRRLEEGGVGIQVFAAFVASSRSRGKAFSDALALVDLVDRTCERSGGRLARANTASEARAIAGGGTATAALAAVENGHAIEEDLRKLETLRRRGVVYMTLTHAKNLGWAASSGEDRCPFAGLTAFGRKVVEAMNDLGMIVDVSHVHETTFWDVAKISRKPFIASHSNTFSLCPVPRNLTDDQVRAVAASGGMIGINFFPGFLDATYAKKQDELLGDMFAALDRIEKQHEEDPPGRMREYRRLAREMRTRMASYRPGLDRVVDHVEHLVSLVGDDHVGFGSDFDGVGDLPDGLEDCARYPALLDRMRERGFSRQSIEKIAAGNFLRVLEANAGS
jgi:membrane dipeptidase